MAGSDNFLNNKDEIRTHFSTREGLYRVISVPSEYSRPSRYPLDGGRGGNLPVRLSFVSVSPANGGPWKPNDDHTLSGTLGLGEGSGYYNTAHGGAGQGHQNYDDNGYSQTSERHGYGHGNEPPNSGGGNVPSGFHSPHDSEDIIGFNVGKDLFIYQFHGAQRPLTMTRLIEKKGYRGPSPTCHDFNHRTATVHRLMLLVGFSLGQIQLIDPITKEESKLFNEDRLIDGAKVTCVRWVPGSSTLFVASYSSGHIYLYDDQLTPLSTGGGGGGGGNTLGAPSYQIFKQGTGFCIHTCKTKGAVRRNPVYRWTIDGCRGVNEFVFSPCSRYLALVAQDGYLHVFNYDHQELVGSMKSYFGGLRCVAWSPDSRYVVTGGEDDLVTVWSLAEKRVVCRGQGHRSWVTAVAFDSFTSRTAATATSASDDSPSSSSSSQRTSNDDRNKPVNGALPHLPPQHALNSPSSPVRRVNRPTAGAGGTGGSGGSAPPRETSRRWHSGEDESSLISYRFGSVGEDATLCLWDLTDDVLTRHNAVKSSRTSAVMMTTTEIPTSLSIVANGSGNGIMKSSLSHAPVVTSQQHSPLFTSSSESSGLATRFASVSLSEHHGRGGAKDANKKQRSTNSLGGASIGGRSPPMSLSAAAASLAAADEALRLLGTPACPRITDVPLIEAMTCKRIARERLTSIAFRRDCIVTACMEGIVLTWARPSSCLVEEDGARL